MVDILCRELRENAADHAAELISAFRTEGDERVRRLLLAAMCEAKLSEALPVFKEHLGSHDEVIRYWSEQGLQALNTPEARKALGEASLSLGISNSSARTI